MRKISVRVIGGTCQGGHHKVGTVFEIDCDAELTPGGMCFGAFGSVFPYIMILLCDGTFSWEETPSKTRVHCPDPKGIILEIEKLENA